MAPETDLVEWGFCRFFAEQVPPNSPLRPGRVVIEHQDRFTLVTVDGRCDRHLSGTLLRSQGERRPAVGDWVLVSQDGQIVNILERKTAFQRRHPRGHLQVVAANVDTVFIVTSANAEFNARRLERYLTAIAASGAEAAIVLTKVDLCEDLAPYRRALEAVAGSRALYFLATPNGDGLAELRSSLSSTHTLALVGSSGVGKSTLANALMDKEQFPTAPIRERDAKGRHTTTRRELARLPGDLGTLIDTPGMRELSTDWDRESLDAAFDDIRELAATCQFRNCDHDKEPGCAVRGTVAPSRLESFRRLVADSKGKEHSGSRRRRGKRK